MSAPAVPRAPLTLLCPDPGPVIFPPAAPRTRSTAWVRPALLSVLWFVGVVALLLTVAPPVIVVHWANGHMVDSESLYPAFAREFNHAGIRTASGRPIQVRIVRANSGEIAGELISRILRGTTLDKAKPNPTLVTPAADHWLGEVNQSVGRTVVDLDRLQTPATTLIGIVTTRDLARCIGWPDREVGFADVASLATGSPESTDLASRCRLIPRARTGFTYPARSSTARSVLYSLYAIAAGTSPERLSLEDVDRPSVRQYISSFRNAVDCYLPDTLDLNRKMVLEPSCADFYFLAEDNLVKLYQGKIQVAPGQRRGLERDLVMIYPREGAVVHNHSAFLVRASWVTADQADAAARWITFLMAEPQQQSFMQEGFRRGTQGDCVHPLGSPFRPCTERPSTLIYPDKIDPAVAVEISHRWP
jgi:Ca-activated chloride channel homolog